MSAVVLLFRKRSAEERNAADARADEDLAQALSTLDDDGDELARLMSLVAMHLLATRSRAATDLSMARLARMSVEAMSDALERQRAAKEGSHG